MPLTSKIEYEKRVFAVQTWIVEGVQSAMIVRKILENKWCTSTRQAERLISTARDRWTQVEEADIKQKRQLKIIELQQMKRSLKDAYRGTPAGLRALTKIDELIIKLEGMNPASEHVIKGDPAAPIHVNTTSNVDYSKLSDEVLLAIIEAKKEEAK